MSSLLILGTCTGESADRSKRRRDASIQRGRQPGDMSLQNVFLHHDALQSYNMRQMHVIGRQGR